jgi:hypothetical protein
MTLIDDLLMRIENSSPQDEPENLYALLLNCLLHLQLLRDGVITFESIKVDAQHKAG